MGTYTDVQKKQRKQTIRAREMLDIKDGGHPPTPPGRLVFHPRKYNKPLACMAGKHQWTNKVVMGVPFLYCKKCGAGAPRDSYHDVLTDKELRANVPDPIKNINKTDSIQDMIDVINRRSRK